MIKTLYPCPTARNACPKAEVVFPLPLPVMTITRPRFLPFAFFAEGDVIFFAGFFTVLTFPDDDFMNGLLISEIGARWIPLRCKGPPHDFLSSEQCFS